MDTKKFIRKSFPVEAVQVTDENMQELAEWSGGEIRYDEKGDYIYIDVLHALKEDQTKAFVGKWVLKSEKGLFKVYTNNAFRNHFLEDTSTEINVTSINNPVGRSATGVNDAVREILRRTAPDGLW